MIKKDLLCEHLWNHLVVDFRTQEFRMCCKAAPISTSEKVLQNKDTQFFLNSEIVRTARKEMLQGIKTKYCKQCWDIEERGLNSHRTSYQDWEKNVFATNFKNKEFESSDLESLSRSEHPNNLDIQLGNTCDLKCIYCSDRFSSSWESENKKFGNMEYEKNFPSFKPNSKNHQTLFEETFWALFSEKKYLFDRIAFLGGEPLISSNFYLILEKLLENYQPRMNKQELNIITNLNTPAVFFDKFVKILPEISKKFTVNINVSMESWGQQAEYIRNGLDFDRFLKNFQNLFDLKLPIKFTTITSINFLCLSTLEKYIRWIREQETKNNIVIEVHYNIISYPQFLSLDLADHQMLKYVKSIVEFIEHQVIPNANSSHQHWNRYLSHLKAVEDKLLQNNEFNPKILADFKQFTSDIKVRRGLSFFDVFPEYAELSYFK